MLAIVLLVGGGCSSDEEKEVIVPLDKKSIPQKENLNQPDTVTSNNSLSDNLIITTDTSSNVNLENINSLIQPDPLSNQTFVRNQNITSPDELILSSRSLPQTRIPFGTGVRIQQTNSPQSQNNSALQIRPSRTTQIQQQRNHELIKLNIELDEVLIKITEAERNNGTLKEAFVNHDIELHSTFSKLDELSTRIKNLTRGRITELLKKAIIIQDEVREVKNDLASINLDITLLRTRYGLELKYNDASEEFEWDRKMIRVTSATFLQMIEWLDASPEDELVEWKPYLILIGSSEYQIISDDVLKLQVYELLMSLNEKVVSFGKKNKLLMNESTLKKWRSIARRANDVIEYLD